MIDIGTPTDPGDQDPPAGPSRPDLPTSHPGLVLRELTERHAHDYYAVLDRNRAHISRHGDHQDERRATPDSVSDYFEAPPDQNIRYGIWLDDRLIGRADLNPVDPPRYSIGYWLDEQHTGRGYTTAACAALIDYARTALDATDIFAGVTHGNAKSVAVLERLGFRPVADLDTYTRFQLRLTRPAGPQS